MSIINNIENYNYQIGYIKIKKDKSIKKYAIMDFSGRVIEYMSKNQVAMLMGLKKKGD